MLHFPVLEISHRCASGPKSKVADPIIIINFCLVTAARDAPLREISTSKYVENTIFGYRDHAQVRFSRGDPKAKVVYNGEKTTLFLGSAHETRTWARSQIPKTPY
ncbi:hypothetical protein Ddc_10200 [Ditylenchus destructor]|nr:hypothetical protein Ddc_10200 [Ditylenchus destructor]